MRETLNRFKPTCEIICWTAGHPEYANKVMDYIDPDRSIFDMRLFRDQCYVTSKGLYIKDLRMINRELDRCILVDNYLYSFGFQIENGIMILPFQGETDDTELLTLGEYLENLMKQGNFREFNSRHFRYKELAKLKNMQDAKKVLLGKN